MPKSVLHFQRFFFQFLDLLRILFSRFPLHCRVLLSSLVALPRKTFLIFDHLAEKTNDLMENAQTLNTRFQPIRTDSYGLSLSSIISHWYRAFTLTQPASMTLYWNKRKRLHNKRVHLTRDWLGKTTWPSFHCPRTLIWTP